MAKLSITIAFLLACFSVTIDANSGSNSDTISYVPACKPPDGFELESSRLVEITPEGVFSSLWRRQGPKKELDIVKIEKLPTIRRLKKYDTGVRENWRRGKDGIEFEKSTHPDAETLKTWIDSTLRAYAVMPTKKEPPTVGERAWIWIDKSGPGDSLALLTSEGLNMVRVWVSIKSADIEEVERVAMNIAKQTLNNPFPVQAIPLAERIDAYVGKVNKRLGFDNWKGKTNIGGKTVDRLDIDEDFFSKFSKNTRIDTPEEARGHKIGAKLIEASGVEVEVDIDVAEDPTAAQEKMLRLMSLNGMPADYEKCDPNDPDEQIKVGDVCFKFHPSTIHGTRGNLIYHKVFFCRNNVSVYLRTAYATDPKQDARLPAMASLIDEKLQALLILKGSAGANGHRDELRRKESTSL
jgi:hypothetical protein